MKRVLSASLIVALSSSLSFAQLPGLGSLGIDPEKQAPLLMEELGQNIEMSNDQFEKMTKVQKDFLVPRTKLWTAELLVK